MVSLFCGNKRQYSRLMYRCSIYCANVLSRWMCALVQCGGHGGCDSAHYVVRVNVYVSPMCCRTYEHTSSVVCQGGCDSAHCVLSRYRMFNSSGCVVRLDAHQFSVLSWWTYTSSWYVIRHDAHTQLSVLSGWMRLFRLIMIYDDTINVHYLRMCCQARYTLIQCVVVVELHQIKCIRHVVQHDAYISVAVCSQAVDMPYVCTILVCCQAGCTQLGMLSISKDEHYSSVFCRSGCAQHRSGWMRTSSVCR